MAYLTIVLLILAIAICITGIIGCALIVWALIQMGKDEHDENNSKH